MLTRLRLVAQKAGVAGAARYAATKLVNFALRYVKIGAAKRPFWLSIDGCEYPIEIRTATSDIDVFCEVFVLGGYAGLETLGAPALIVDCGANVGYASIYFLNRFPKSHVIAVEPDSENYEVCRRNLSPYGNRVTLIRAGVWCRDVGLKVFQPDGGDNREWSIQVRECARDEPPDVRGMTLATILEGAGYRQIDLLKMDIERSELAVFSHNYQGWLAHTTNIAIELHGEDCRAAFFNALNGFEYELASAGQLTSCRNIRSMQAR